MSRRFMVAVFGSGEREHAERAEPLGRWIAEQGHDLLTGGGFGVMAAACRGFASVPGRRGQSVGILPGRDRPDYPNAWVDIAVRTHLPARGPDAYDPGSRNHINLLTCDVAVALPGSVGTRAELQLAVYYARPIIAWGWAREELPATCEALPLASDLSHVQRFVQASLAGG